MDRVQPAPLSLPASERGSHRAEPWLIRLSRRLPAHYALATLVPAALFLMVGLLSYQREATPATLLSGPIFSRLLTVALVTPYTLIMLRYLYHATAQMLVGLRPLVLVDNDEYARLSYTMLTVDRRLETVLLVVGLLGALGALALEYFINIGFRSGLERFPITHFIILTGEISMGILVALFGYTGVERGLALFRLFQRPLAISVFNHVSLEPLNRLSLHVTLALVGLVSLPIVVWGGFQFSEPVQILILGVSALSAVVAFLLPLWGAHRQMTAVRDRAQQTNNAKLAALYNELHERVDRKVDGRDVADEVNALVQFNRLLAEAPTWPYQGARIGLQLVAPVALPLLLNFAQQVLRPLLTKLMQ